MAEQLLRERYDSGCFPAIGKSKTASGMRGSSSSDDEIDAPGRSWPADSRWDEPGSISEEDLRLLETAYRSVVAASDVVLFRRGLSRSHHRAMFVLRRERSATVGELARGIRISTQALQKTLRDIVDRGYATMVSDPRDRRRRAIRLTPLGEELESQVTGLQLAALGRMHDRIGAEAVDLWRLALRALANADEVGAHHSVEGK